jgi:hypothetical protein
MRGAAHARIRVFGDFVVDAGRRDTAVTRWRALKNQAAAEANRYAVKDTSDNLLFNRNCIWRRSVAADHVERNRNHHEFVALVVRAVLRQFLQVKLLAE